jgi:hypothetical protein
MPSVAAPDAFGAKRKNVSLPELEQDRAEHAAEIVAPP